MMLNHVIVGGVCGPNYIDRCALSSVTVAAQLIPGYGHYNCKNNKMFLPVYSILWMFSSLLSISGLVHMQIHYMIVIAILRTTNFVLGRITKQCNCNPADQGAHPYCSGVYNNF